MSKKTNSKKHLRKVAQRLAYAQFHSEQAACKLYGITKRTLQDNFALLDKIPELAAMVDDALKPLQLDSEIHIRTKRAQLNGILALENAINQLDPTNVQQVNALIRALESLHAMNVSNQAEHDSRTLTSITLDRESQSPDDREAEAKMLLSEAELEADLAALEDQPAKITN